MERIFSVSLSSPKENPRGGGGKGGEGEGEEEEEEDMVTFEMKRWKINPYSSF